MRQTRACICLHTLHTGTFSTKAIKAAGLLLRHTYSKLSTTPPITACCKRTDTEESAVRERATVQMCTAQAIDASFAYSTFLARSRATLSRSVMSAAQCGKPRSLLGS